MAAMQTSRAAFGFAPASPLPGVRFSEAAATRAARTSALCTRTARRRRAPDVSRTFVASANEPGDEQAPAPPAPKSRVQRRRLLSVAPAAAAAVGSAGAGCACSCHGGPLQRLLARAFADTYDEGMVEYETAMRDVRAGLLSRARGRVLEVGIGTGACLPFYRFGPGGVDSVVGVEPSEFMALHCAEAARRLGVEERVEVVPGRAESLPLPDASFDTAVSSLVLCSVSDQGAALAELRRVLRPGGRLLLLEHVLAPARRPLLRAAQALLDPLQVLLADGCHLNRRTGDALQEAAFAEVEVSLIDAPVFPLISPHLVGSAVK